jgi:electron transfer flavoprotein alpha subunit
MGNEVLIVTFASTGFDRAAQGVAGAGRALAGQLGGSLLALVLGGPDQETVSAVAAVADSVIVLDQPELADYQPDLYLAAVQQVCSRIEPRAVLLGNDTASLELTPRIAHRLGGSPMSDGTAVTVADGAIRVARSAYGGKANAVFELTRSPAVVWLRARGFDPARPTGRSAAVERTAVDLPDATPTRIVDRHVEALEGIPLQEARVVIGGGRGIGGPEPFDDLRKMAQVMTAAVGASRSACDEGWVPPSYQIGQTGKKIAPQLYLAIAISGAAQHMLGVSDAKTIAAINNDPDAPIFRHCSFAIVEDYRKAVPLLIDRLGDLTR